MADKHRKRMVSVALLAPASLILGIIFLLPFLQLLVYSFWRFVPGSLIPDTTFTLENYRHLLEEPYYSRVYFRTIKISTIATALTFVLAYPLSRFISRQKTGLKGFLLVLVMLPLIGGAMIQTLGWLTLLMRYGAVNGILLALHVIDKPIQFLGKELGIVIGLVQSFLPLLVLPLVAALGAIDPSLEDAAKSLGANWLRVFFEVVFPLSLPGAVAGTILVFIANLTSFVTPSMLGQGKIQVFGTVAYQQAIEVMNWPFSSAFSLSFLFLMGIAAAIALYSRRFLVRRTAMGETS